MSDLPQVVIVGGPSAGGSGATRRFDLPNTELVVSLSSMVSFRGNGALFDGNGIEVDVDAKPALRDFIEGSDTVLIRGMEVLIQKQESKAKTVSE